MNPKPTISCLPIKLIALAALILSAGCSTVEPWQRQDLARPEMAWAPDSMGEQLQEQAYFSKEGSSGGGKASGGGCGCN